MALLPSGTVQGAPLAPASRRGGRASGRLHEVELADLVRLERDELEFRSRGDRRLPCDGAKAG